MDDMNQYDCPICGKFGSFEAATGKLMCINKECFLFNQKLDPIAWDGLREMAATITKINDILGTSLDMMINGKRINFPTSEYDKTGKVVQSSFGFYTKTDVKA